MHTPRQCRIAYSACACHASSTNLEGIYDGHMLRRVAAAASCYLLYCHLHTCLADCALLIHTCAQQQQQQQHKEYGALLGTCNYWTRRKQACCVASIVCAPGTLCGTARLVIKVAYSSVVHVF
jgi:hypothetical protein